MRTKSLWMYGAIGGTAFVIFTLFGTLLAGDAKVLEQNGIHAIATLAKKTSSPSSTRHGDHEFVWKIDGANGPVHVRESVGRYEWDGLQEGIQAKVVYFQSQRLWDEDGYSFVRGDENTVANLLIQANLFIWAGCAGGVGFVFCVVTGFRRWYHSF